MLHVAKQVGAKPKAKLALIEAGIVESKLRNLSYGDADSIGILQIRVGIHGHRVARSIRRSSRAFLTKGFTGRGGAIQVARAHPRWTAGHVAQAVQGSAFPARYDQVRQTARKVTSTLRWRNKRSHQRVCRTASCVERVAGKRCSQRNPRACVKRAILAYHLSGWQSSWMYRVAGCESTWNPYAHNSSGASGLYQFLPSTWATTPYGRHSIWSAKWQALAAAWMLRQGRSREWECH